MHPRRVWWVIVIAMALIGILGLGKLWYSDYLVSNWAELRVSRESDLRSLVQNRFRARVEELFRTAGLVARDTVTLRRLIANQPADMLTGNERLNALQKTSGSSVDVVDPNAALVAWSGPALIVQYERFVSADSQVVIATAGLRSALAASVQADVGLTIIASEPFDRVAEVSERFVPAEGFRSALAHELGQNVEILTGDRIVSSGDGRRLRVALTDVSGNPLAAVLVDAPTLEEEIQRMETAVSEWVGGLIAIFSGFLAVVLFPWTLRLRSSFLRMSLLLTMLWTMRFVWLEAGFPSTLVGGWLFDPTHFASPFGGGIASSLGEVFLSVLALLFSVIIVARELGPVEFKSKLEGPTIPRFTVFIISAFAVSFGLNVVFRAYGATLHSFVYDATLKFINPSEIVPPAPVVLMHVNVLLVTVTLILLVALVVRQLMKWYKNLNSSHRSIDAFAVVSAVYIAAAILFRYVDGSPQVQWHIPFLALGASAVLVWVNAERWRTPSGIAFIFIFSFVMSTPVLDSKIHDKEEDNLRLYASELTQPVDAWLSFVTNESFRSAREAFLQLQVDQPGGQIAFPLWARTLMSSEGYNSTFVLYDDSGVEVDRFAVGMTSYEQSELLRRLFDVDEEVLNVVERRVPGGLIKYYGVWGSVRDSSDRPIAFLSLILAASDQALFRGEAPEPLRSFEREEFGRLHQSVFISEFQDGKLVASSDANRYAGTSLPPEVKFAFEGGNTHDLKVLEEIQDRQFETLYVRDHSRAGRVIAISIQEVGLRWHLFNLVKVAVLYAVLLALACGFVVAIQWAHYRSMITGFRGRLVLAFLVVAIVPLILFGYYNREFARERLAVNITNRLKEDLDLIARRILTAMEDEEDVGRGLNDDFCETVAAEFGVDFSIYRRTEILTSSRPELYSSGLVDARLPGDVFAKIVVAGLGYTETMESIGDVGYAVGFRPLVMEGRTLGVLAVPALYRQTELEAEVAERNASTLAIYGVLVLLTGIVGVALANQLSQPVRDLTRAASDVGEGNLDARVTAGGSGEIRELVTTFNEMVAELKRSREELRQGERERAWKEMAKQVAHEIKNPLTPMKLLVQHLRQAFKDKAANRETLVDEITQTLTEQINTLARIASEFSNFARMPERMFERVDVHQLLREAIQLFGEVKGIEIQTDFCDIAPSLIADREELRRVCINIIRNAIQAMDERGQIVIGTEIRGHRCIISFADSGPGIPPELQSRVFEPNFSTKTDGMGLGLAMARKVIEDLNGVISLESTVGKGTTVIVALPMTAGTHG
ncbi:MAG: ATP-binding protein [Bacteroidota bacterium]